MSNNTHNVHPDLAEIALEKADGFAFERFAQDFLAAVEGSSFIPLGGVKDGGADGIFERSDGKAYYQITRQENHRAKIRKTKERLLAFGRSIRVLYYITSRVLPHSDKEEELLSEELGVIVKIRDRKYILSHINNSLGAINAFNNHLLPFTNYLSTVAAAGNIHSVSRHVRDPSVFVFLQHEITNRLGNRKLIHSLCDTLILWSLSDTDPESGVFMSEVDIRNKIFSEFPWAKNVINPHIGPRLEILRKKDENDRQIRWYQKDKKYCLPFETRQIIRDENSIDEALIIRFIEEIKSIASDLFNSDDGEYQTVAEVCLLVIHMIFERQGLLFSHFLSTKNQADAPLVVADCIDDALIKVRVEPDKIQNYRDYLEKIIRRLFYHASPTQREFLNNLSRTYVLLFTMNAEPKIVEYFSNMGASFELFLGTDIFVKALSERYLNPDDQVAKNLLRIASASGMSLYLSECVLEEVYTHIRATFLEFNNNFAKLEQYITPEIGRNSEKILIRAYFYAKNDGKVASWSGFLSQFISYRNILSPAGKEELRKYLVSEYGLKFVENSELKSLCNEDDVKNLAESLSADKENWELAYNSALLVYGIYAKRKANKETGVVSEYGLKTWWMTNQSRILQHTSSVVQKNRSQQYIMRPEFLLNFISMSPSCVDVRTTFKNIFPSNFGIQLGHRLSDGVFRDVIENVSQWKDYEPGRIAALMSDLSDQLKCDRLKRYESNL